MADTTTPVTRNHLENYPMTMKMASMECIGLSPTMCSQFQMAKQTLINHVLYRSRKLVTKMADSITGEVTLARISITGTNQTIKQTRIIQRQSQVGEEYA